MPKKSEPIQYYEVWGEIATALKFHRRLNVILGIIVILAMVWSILHALKPPLVVRVDETGEAYCISNYLTESGPTRLEAERFTREFMRYYLEANSTTVSSDVKESLAMMTRDFAGAVFEEMKKNKIIGNIAAAAIKSEMEIAENECKKRGEEYWICKSTGIMHTSSLATKKSSSRPFSSQATLMILPRTEDTANGLLVADFENQYYEPIETSSASIPEQTGSRVSR